MPMLFFDIEFNGGESKAKAMSPKVGKKPKQYEDKEERKMFISSEDGQKDVWVSRAW